MRRQSIAVVILMVLFAGSVSAPGASKTEVHPHRPDGPPVQWFGWDLKGNKSRTAKMGSAKILYGQTPANLVRIPILTAAHSPDGTVNRKAYGKMLTSMRNILEVRPETKIFASLKLLGKDTFAPWLDTDEPGRIFNEPVKKPDAGKYTRLVAQYIAFLAEEGFKLDFLGPGNEVSGAFDPERHVYFYEHLGKEMDVLKLGSEFRRFQIIAPETFGLNSAIKYVEALDRMNAEDTYQIVGSHYYAHKSSGQVDDWETLAKKNRKPMWHTEVHFGDKGDRSEMQSIRDSIAVLFASNRAGVEGFVWWGGGPGDSLKETVKRSLTRTVLGSEPVMTRPRYQAKGDRPGELLSQAYRRADTVYLWICNPGKTIADHKVEIKSGKIGEVAVECRVAFSGGEETRQLETIRGSAGNTLTIAEIPAESIILMTIKLD